MVAARDANFLGDGTVDPFTGVAPALTAEEAERQEQARRARILEEKTNATRNINARPGGYFDQRGVSDREAVAANNRMVAAERYDRTGSIHGNRQGFWGNLADDPLTAGILAAPLAVTGAGAAIGGAGALGFGLGEGTLVGGSAAAGVPAMTEPFMMASPYAAGAGGGAAGGAAGAAGSAAGTAAGAAGDAWTTKDTVKTLIPIAASLGEVGVRELIAGGDSKERRALLAKQEELAMEAQRRRGQMQDARMNALAQQVLAFSPHNQTMAQLFGPQAAFTPEQAAGMVQGPKPPPLDPSLVNYKGGDPKKQAQVEEWVRRQKEYEASEAARREQVMGGFQQPGPGPAPIRMPTPQAARRY